LALNYDLLTYNAASSITRNPFTKFEFSAALRYKSAGDEPSAMCNAGPYSDRLNLRRARWTGYRSPGEWDVGKGRGEYRGGRL